MKPKPKYRNANQTQGDSSVEKQSTDAVEIPGTSSKHDLSDEKQAPNAQPAVPRMSSESVPIVELSKSSY